MKTKIVIVSNRHTTFVVESTWTNAMENSILSQNPISVLNSLLWKISFLFYMPISFSASHEISDLNNVLSTTESLNVHILWEKNHSSYNTHMYIFYCLLNPSCQTSAPPIIPLKLLKSINHFQVTKSKNLFPLLTLIDFCQ